MFVRFIIAVFAVIKKDNYIRSFIFVVVVVVGGVFVLLVCLVGGGCCCFLGEGGCVFCLFFVLVGIAVIVIFVASH